MMERYSKMEPDDPERITLAQDISLKQMEINFYSTEAYLNYSAVQVATTKSGAGLTPKERLNSVLSNLEMMEHFVHESGGMVQSPAQEYELYKYMFRISESMYLPQKDLFFDYLTKQIYTVNREGPKAMKPAQVMDIYNDFMKYVTKYLKDNSKLISE